jgi:LuxR family maltose regulon positive regulatory protein
MAHQAFADFMTKMRLAGNILVAISGTFLLADIRMAQGHLHEAVRSYGHSLELATTQGEPVLQGTADLYVGLGELQCEQGDLKAASQNLLTSKKLGEQASLPELQFRSSVAKARIRAAQGDLDGALDQLHEAEHVAVLSSAPDVRPVAALKTRLWVKQGRLTEALDWARERDLTVEDDLSYLREFEHITLARVLIAQYKSDRVKRSIHEAAGLLARLLKEAEEGGRMGSVVEILVLQAVAHQVEGDLSLALVPLERALTLAEPEGCVRMFADEGSPMAQLLFEAAARGIIPDYSGKLLAAIKARKQMSQGKSSLATSPSPQPLTDPLSERVLEVLRLLKSDLSGPEIARELVIALSTVRSHTKSIYSKLNVNNRRTAVKEAEKLDLI